MNKFPFPFQEQALVGSWKRQFLFRCSRAHLARRQHSSSCVQSSCRVRECCSWLWLKNLLWYLLIFLPEELECSATRTLTGFGISHGLFHCWSRDCSLHKLSPANLQEPLPLKASFGIVWRFFWLFKQLPHHFSFVLKITLLMIDMFQYEGFFFSFRQPG